MSVVVITGSAGLIGSHLITAFLSRKFTVIGIDSLIGGYKDNMPVDDNFFFYNVDITDFASIKNIFNKFKPETVIHCAALAHEGLSVFSPKTITESIYTGTISVASAAISNNTRYFINTSSMARYGNIQTPFEEHMTPNPIDPYGLAKLQAEQQLNLLQDIHGIKVFHMVPHNVCGPHQCYSDPFRNVMSIFGNRVLQDKPVYIYGDGLQKRSFSHIQDCVDAYMTLYDRKEEISGKNVFNIGPDDGTEITVLELANRVHAHFNKEPNVINIPPRPREVKDAWVSTEKAKKYLNYATRLTVEDTIRDTITWIKQSPIRDFNYHLPVEIVTDKTPKTWTERLFNK